MSNPKEPKTPWYVKLGNGAMEILGRVLYTGPR